MGEAKRRKQFLGKSYGQSPKTLKSRFKSSSLEIGDIIKSTHPNIAHISKQARNNGVIDGGIVIPFILKIPSGGMLMGLGFPSVNATKNVKVGLVVVKIIGAEEQVAIEFYRSIEKEVVREVGLEFKKIFEASSSMYDTLMHELGNIAVQR